MVLVNNVGLGVNVNQNQVFNNALVVSGSILADSFIGDGRYIYNVQGFGLNDNHSLERFGSRLIPDRLVTQNSQKGDDVLFISGDPYVGINNSSPVMPLDMYGLVLFSDRNDAYGKIQTAMLIAAALVEGIGFAALFAV